MNCVSARQGSHIRYTSDDIAETIASETGESTRDPLSEPNVESASDRGSRRCGLTDD